MRKFLYASLVAILPLASCVNRENTEKLIYEKDSLTVVVAQKDSAINEIFMSMNAIAENLDAIKRRENIIASDMQNDSEVSKQSPAKINEDIEAIDRLLIENKQTIGRLQQTAAQLKKANTEIAGLEKLIAQLNKQVESKDQEIAVLRKNLENMHVQVTELNEKVTGLNTQLTGLSEEKASLEGEVKMQNDILNSGYYIIGQEKELLSKEIVYKSGFIGRTLKINENRSLDSFTQVDIRQFDEVKIGHKKATLVSTHPAGSFEFITDAKGNFETLVIKDKSKFWEYSKVMVISYK